MKKHLLLIGLASILVLSACSGGGGETTNTSVTSQTSTTSQTSATSQTSSTPSSTGTSQTSQSSQSVTQKYTLTFNSNGGTSVAPIVAEANTPINKPNDPAKDGYVFVCWCLDQALKEAVEWPLTLTSNKTVYAKWNEKIDVKGYLLALLKAKDQNPYSYIPDTMKPTNTSNYVSPEQVNYDFRNNTSVSSIKYGGFGEQWQMVIDNIQQSEMFYKVFAVADGIISASVAAFNNWFDKNPSSTNKEIDETGYFALVNFANGVLTYVIQIKSGISIPFFGEVIPQIDMVYNVASQEKAVRVNLTDTNALRYVITNDSYTFGIKYGVEALSRSAYCQLNKVNNGYEGHIYEYITLKDKDRVKSCADFYINDTYTSVVGNKASGIIGMDGYINELYKTSEGKLIGYKVQETKTIDFPVIGEVTATYHTLWFNLNNISGINSVKVTAHTDDNENKYNPNNIHVNGSSTLFKPTYNVQAFVVNTSRKYDIELRTQYRYGVVDSALSTFETKIPMMFIQDDNDKDTNFSDFENDIKKTNDIVASVNLSNTYLSKIREDYDKLIPIFKTNKELVDSDAIQAWIGNPIK